MPEEEKKCYITREEFKEIKIKKVLQNIYKDLLSQVYKLAQTTLTGEAPNKKEKTTAEILSEKQQSISISEFFTKNRHLLGFDNPRKALLTTVREAVDNALDACGEMKILPEIKVIIDEIGIDKYKVTVEDNGPGIVRKQIPNIFARLLYGSKFHRLRQSLTGDEPILIRINGKIELRPIGTVVDTYLQEEGVVETENIEVPCFDWETYKYSFQTVSHLIKHKRENEIYKIQTLYGKSIKVTGCHSLFTINKKTLKVEEAEARTLKTGDIVLAPKHIPLENSVTTICSLDFISQEYAKKRYWFLYTDKEDIKRLFSQANIIHAKKGKDKSRKYYRFSHDTKFVDVLDDSYKQYIQKGFIPVWLAIFLAFRPERGIIKTYYHGETHSFPLHIEVNSLFMKLVGLFVAEGHTDARHIGFTFSRHERDLVTFVSSFAYAYGIGYSIEERPERNSVRVYFYGGFLSHLFRQCFGRGAKNKKIPSFVFTAGKEQRQDFLDYLYLGDGHSSPKRNYLTLCTASQELAQQIQYLWLLQGVQASFGKRFEKGLRPKADWSYFVNVCGEDINCSNHFRTHTDIRRRKSDLNVRLLAKALGREHTVEFLNYIPLLKQLEFNKEYEHKQFQDIFQKEKAGYSLRFLLDDGYLVKNNLHMYSLTEKTQIILQDLEKIQKLLTSDFVFLPIQMIERIDHGYEYVYDLSVPHGENFVGGLGGIACHNSRGAQGIGISAAALYGQLTTGKPIRIISKIGPKVKAHYFELHLNTKTNEPEIIIDEERDWEGKDHGTKVQIELEGKYQQGKLSVDEFLQLTAISNPEATIIYKAPGQDAIEFARASTDIPKETKEIQPHPYGVELGTLMRMLKDTKASSVQGYLQQDFCRVSASVAKEICEKAGVEEREKPANISRDDAEKIFNAIKQVKIMAPPTDCLSPIGEEQLLKGLKKEINAEFYAAVTRAPVVYRGFPFQIECAIAYGGNLPKDELARVIRYANKVPLQHQPGACALTKSVIQTAWKNYNISQSRGTLPAGPIVISIHIASVWVPFTSESKEAVASYPDIIKEVRLALQDTGRKLASYIRKTVKAREQQERVNLFEKYIPELAGALATLTGEKKNELQEELEKILKKGLKDLLAEVKEAEKEKISEEGIAYGDKQGEKDNE